MRKILLFLGVLVAFSGLLITQSLANGITLSSTSATLSESATTTITADTSNYTNLKLSFNYNVTNLDGNDQLTYGWATGSNPVNIIDHIDGHNDSSTTNPADIGSITDTNLPAEAVAGDLHIYFISNGTTGDDASVSNVTLTGDPVVTNTAPSANSLSISTNENQATSSQLIGNDTDGDTLTFATTSNPTLGTLTSFDSATGDFTYTPNTDATGTDSFNFVVNDGQATSSEEAVNITINEVSTPPTLSLVAPTLSISNVASTSLTLNWNTIASATSYEVFQNNNNTSLATTTATTYNVTGLTASTTYNFSVVVTDGTNFATSTAISTTTLADTNSGGSGGGGGSSYTETTPPTLPNISGQVIYNTITSPFPASYPSEGFEANQMSALGDKVTFAGTNRNLDKVAVTLTSWACQTGSWNTSCTTNPGSTFSQPVTLNLYNVANDGSVGSLIKSVTQTFEIPYRPSTDATCSTNTNWRDTSGNCHSGYNYVAVFDLTGVTVPDTIYYTVAVNTSHYGDSPTVTVGPADSLNVGLSNTTPSVGTHNKIYQVATHQDNSLASYQVAATFTAQPSDSGSPKAHFTLAPEDGSYVNSNFDVAGVASDETYLKSVFFDVRDSQGSVSGCKSGTATTTYSDDHKSATTSCKINTSNLQNGKTYTLRIHAGDDANHGGGESRAITFDTGLPSIHIDSPINDGFVNKNFTITGTASDTESYIDHVNIYVANPKVNNTFNGYAVDNQLATYSSSTGKFTYDVTSLPVGGPYAIKAIAYDAAGNVKYANTVQVTVDTHSPMASFTQAPDDNSFISSNFQVSATATDNDELKGVGFDVRDPQDTTGNAWRAGCVTGTLNINYTDASTSATLSCEINTSNLVEGHTYYVRVHASDYAGYGSHDATTTSERYFTIDRTAPEIISVDPASGTVLTTGHDIQFKFWVKDNLSMDTHIAGQAEGHQQMYFLLTDSKGNWAEGNEQIVASSTDKTHAKYGYVGFFMKNSIDKLVPGPLKLTVGYYYEGQWRLLTDAAGNTFATDTVVATYNLVSDNTAPDIQINNAEVVGNPYYKFDEPINAHIIEDNLADTQLTRLNVSNDNHWDYHTGHYFGLSWLRDGDYSLTATDTAGNATTVTFRVDHTKPVASGSATGGVVNASTTYNPTSFTINANDDESNNAKGDQQSGLNKVTGNIYKYDPSNPKAKSDGYYLLDSNSTTTNSLTLDLSNLSDDKYYVKYNASDLAGNVANTKEFYFTIDNSAPATPTLISPTNNAIVSSGSLTQVWSDTSTDIDHYEYESYNDASMTSLRWSGSFSATSKTASVSDGTTYWWRVMAVDTAGNKSDWSDLWKVSVEDNNDNGNGTTITSNAPAIIAVSPAEGDFTLINNESLVLRVTATDTDSDLSELEVDDNYASNTSLDQFSVYASTTDPYGDATAENLFNTVGVNVNYYATSSATGTVGTWVIDLGPAITQSIITQGSISFSMRTHDLAGNVSSVADSNGTWGNDNNTYTYTIASSTNDGNNGNSGGDQNNNFSLLSIPGGSIPYTFSSYNPTPTTGGGLISGQVKGATVFQFPRNLGLGMTGVDVQALQVFLNNSGYALAQSGVGSKGQETNYFGSLTENALARYQSDHANAILVPAGITSGVGTGYFGNSTRSSVNTTLANGSAESNTINEAIDKLN